jgi:hypothetical protein
MEKKQEIENLLMTSIDFDRQNDLIDDTTVYEFTLYRINSKNKKIQNARTNINANKDLLIATFRYYYGLLESLPQSYMVEVRTTYKGMWEDTHVLSFTRRKVIEDWYKYDK